MVVISTPGLSDDSGVTHARVGWPSRYTVHAPHSAMPQPYLVPVRFRLSRRIHRSGVSPATLGAMSTRSLLTKKVGIAESPEERNPAFYRVRRARFRRPRV